MSTSECCAAGSRAGISLATARTRPNVKEMPAATKRTASSAARRRLRTRRRGRGVPFSLRTRKRADSSSGGANPLHSNGAHNRKSAYADLGLRDEQRGVDSALDGGGCGDRLRRRCVDAAGLFDRHGDDVAARDGSVHELGLEAVASGERARAVRGADVSARCDPHLVRLARRSRVQPVEYEHRLSVRTYDEPTVARLQRHALCVAVSEDLSGGLLARVTSA